MTYIQERRERLQNILKQNKGIWVNWIDEGQDYQKEIAHDSYPNDNVESAFTETQEHEGRKKDSYINKAREGSTENKNMLEHCISTLLMEADEWPAQSKKRKEEIPDIDVVRIRTTVKDSRSIIKL